MADAAAAAYEAQRRRQIEENKRRIEELGLRHLAAAAMPPQAKMLKPKHKARVPEDAAAAASVAAPPRRSGRVANLPEQPYYREPLLNSVRIPGPTAVERSHAIAKDKAKELEGELGANYPTFVKTMNQNSIIKPLMRLPPHFCSEHLPDPGKGCVVITLVDEKDDEFDVPYFRWGPNGCYYFINRWKWFAMDHNLADGDCIVFQLVEQRRFKVYIIRADSYLKMTN
ncbi:unnamed protein product [Urochloa decumbens]|uniref:TF-B3 domain-containing protein n=1 Tax=Urochloa decumbens TaxID=240449 RepID=A0ABC8YCM5_9POAL